MWHPLILKIAPSLITEIKSTGKTAFPRETLAFLIGNHLGDTIHVDGLYWPADIKKHATTTQINLQDIWFIEALERAKEEDLDVIGTIHTHPYNYKDNLYCTDRAPSENDYDSILGSLGVLGICTITQSASGRLRSSIRFWQPATALKQELND